MLKTRKQFAAPISHPMGEITVPTEHTPYSNAFKLGYSHALHRVRTRKQWVHQPAALAYIAGYQAGAQAKPVQKGA